MLKMIRRTAEGHGHPKYGPTIILEALRKGEREKVALIPFWDQKDLSPYGQLVLAEKVSEGPTYERFHCVPLPLVSSGRMWITHSAEGGLGVLWGTEQYWHVATERVSKKLRRLPEGVIEATTPPTWPGKDFQALVAQGREEELLQAWGLNADPNAHSVQEPTGSFAPVAG